MRSSLPVVLPLAVFLGFLPAHAQSPPAETLPQPPAVTAPAAPDPNKVILRGSGRWWEDAAFDRRVTLVLKDSDLNAAIDALGKAADLSLIAAGGSKARKKVSLNLRNAPLRDVMLAMANLYGLEWFKSGEVYTITYPPTLRARSTTKPTKSTSRSRQLPPLNTSGDLVLSPNGPAIVRKNPATRYRPTRPKTYIYTPAK